MNNHGDLGFASTWGIDVRVRQHPSILWDLDTEKRGGDDGACVGDHLMLLARS